MSCGSTTCTPSPTPDLQSARQAPHLPSPAESLVAWLAVLVRLQLGWREREELRDLEDRILHDVGLTREQVEHEARLWSIFHRHPRT